MHSRVVAHVHRPHAIGRTSVLALSCALSASLAVVGQTQAQSPPPQPSQPSGDVAPVPVRIADGSCDAPGSAIVSLDDGSAPGPAGDGDSIVYVSVSEVGQPIDQLVTPDRILLVGGSDAEGAIACGALGAIRDEDGTSVTPLIGPSGQFGTALLRAIDDATTVVDVVVVVTPLSGEASPGPAASAAAPSAPSASGVAGNPTREPGTSGAPPFSPLP